ALFFEESSRGLSSSTFRAGPVPVALSSIPRLLRMDHLPGPRLGSHHAASEQALRKRQQNDEDGQRDAGSRDRSREEHGPVSRKTDDRVHERFFGYRTEDDAKNERRDWKFQAFKAIAENAEADNQPKIGDVVPYRQRSDKAQDQHVGRHDRLGKIEDLHKR